MAGERGVRLWLDPALPDEAIELFVSVEGESAVVARREAYRWLFDFLDVDGNGVLEGAEAHSLPTPFGLRQVSAGRLMTAVGAPPASMNQDQDGQLNPDELIAYYEQADCGGCVVTYGADPGAKSLNAAIRERLALRQEGLRGSPTLADRFLALHKLDANNDELISPGELLSSARYPGTNAARLLLPQDQTGESSTDSARRWKIRFVDGNPTLGDSSSAWLESRRSSVRIHLAAGKHAGSLAKLEQLLTQLGQLQSARFAGGVPIDQLEGVPNESELRSFLRLIDANHDGRATVEEGKQWSNVYKRLAVLQPVIAILDLGSSLFPLLDQNHDGSLSNAELRQGPEVLEQAKLIVDGEIAWDRLPRQYRIIVANGLPQSLLDHAPVEAPAWFQAMDRNGDGLVSSGEFLADEAQFRRLDQNGDGYVSPDEL
ncbi:EF-hand domain-containing protein [Blastopirellula retiformator]|uniref:EF-hand domain-containing protein n=1 Tax=Blastopirellula retiformator TaxID=2527970 RepID=UPI001646B57B|nr:EF-hand domain-containing protein [Blastopirellula retiformator]